MSDLTAKKCLPCGIGTPPMPVTQATEMLKQVPGWFLIDNKIVREYKFPDYQSALKFVNQVAAIAETEGHHPDICFTWGKVTITLFTHAANGLTENDYILAAKINELN